MGLLDNNINGYNRARVFEKLNNLSKYNKKYFVAHGTHDDNVHFQQSMVGIRIEKILDAANDTFRAKGMHKKHKTAICK